MNHLESFFIISLGITCLLNCTSCGSSNIIRTNQEKKLIEQAICYTIDWAKTKDTALLYSVISKSEDYLEIHPENNVVKGISEFRRSERFWLDPRFKHVAFEISDLNISLSESENVAWFYCVLDDINEWDGRNISWDNVRWSGTLEKIDDQWKMMQMHFSYPEPKVSKAKMVKPGLISMPDQYEYCISFSPDQKELLVTIRKPDERERIVRYQRSYGSFSVVDTMDYLCVSDDPEAYVMEGFYHPDGDKIFYTLGDSTGCSFWYVNKTQNGWGQPNKLDEAINKDVVLYSTFDSAGNLYFSNVSKRKTCKAIMKNGIYTNPEPTNIKGFHATISPDGKYVLFNARGEDTYGLSDIYVQFFRPDGSLSEPKNLGPLVNTECSESCPSITPDGRKIYFNRHCKDSDEYDLYQISCLVLENL